MDESKLVSYEAISKYDLERAILAAALKLSLSKGDLEGVNLCHKQLFMNTMDSSVTTQSDFKPQPQVKSTDNHVAVESNQSQQLNNTQESKVYEPVKDTLTLPKLEDLSQFNDPNYELPDFLKEFQLKTANFNQDKSHQNLYRLLSVTSFASFADLKQNYWLFIKNIINFKKGFIDYKSWSDAVKLSNLAHDILKTPKLRAQHDLLIQNLPVSGDAPIIKTSLTRIPKLKRKLYVNLVYLIEKAHFISDSSLKSFFKDNPLVGSAMLGITLVQNNLLSAQELNMLLKCLKLINTKVITVENGLLALQEFKQNKTDIKDYLLKHNLINDSQSELFVDNNKVNDTTNPDTITAVNKSNLASIIESKMDLTSFVQSSASEESELVIDFSDDADDAIKDIDEDMILFDNIQEIISDNIDNNELIIDFSDFESESLSEEVKEVSVLPEDNEISKDIHEDNLEEVVVSIKEDESIKSIASIENILGPNLLLDVLNQEYKNLYVKVSNLASAEVKEESFNNSVFSDNSLMSRLIQESTELFKSGENRQLIESSVIKNEVQSAPLSLSGASHKSDTKNVGQNNSAKQKNKKHNKKKGKH